MTEERPSRFTALRIQARRHIEARRRTIAELKRACMEENAVQASSSYDEDACTETMFDAEFERRIFDTIMRDLADEDSFRPVTIDDLMRLGSEDGDKG